MADENSNGNNSASKGVSQLILTFKHDTFELKVGGSIANLDVAIAMCQMAQRTFENQLRAAQLSQTIMQPPMGLVETLRRRQ